MMFAKVLLLAAIFGCLPIGNPLKKRTEFYEFLTWVYKQRAGPVLIVSILRRDREVIADEYTKKYEQEISTNVFQVNCSDNLAMARGLFAIGLDYDIKKATDARNLKYVIEEVLLFFRHKQSLFILQDMPPLNKFTKQFLKESKQIPKMDVLMISNKDDIGTRVIVANYDSFKYRGMTPIINKLSPGLRRKYNEGKFVDEEDSHDKDDYYFIIVY